MTFLEFMTEGKALDPALAGAASIRQTGAGGRKYPERKKSEGERTRVKAVGGGKTVPAKTYKDKADIGVPNRKRSAAGRQQQPTEPKGVKLTAREQQKKARAERLAAKSGAKTKTADELLAKKAKKTVSPKYKQQKATGYTTPERQKITRAGERLVKDIRQGKEKPISQYDPKIRKG